MSKLSEEAFDLILKAALIEHMEREIAKLDQLEPYTMSDEQERKLRKFINSII